LLATRLPKHMEAFLVLLLRSLGLQMAVPIYPLIYRHFATFERFWAPTATLLISPVILRPTFYRYQSDLVLNPVQIPRTIA